MSTFLRAHAAKRGQIPHVAVRQVGREQVRDFVAGIVMKIQDVFPVCGPRVPFNRVACFVRHAMGVPAIERARPNIQRIAFVRCQPAELRAIGRDFWIRPRRIAKQDFAGDKWRQLTLRRTER